MRRIGILTFEYPPKGPQKQVYVWDVETLAALRFYAEYINTRTRAAIVELTWCHEAEVAYFKDREAGFRYLFCFNDQSQKQKPDDLTGSTLEGWTLEESAVLYFRTRIDGISRTRRVSWPAPVANLFRLDNTIPASVGNVIAGALQQATGKYPIIFSRGRLMAWPIEQEDRA